MTEKLLSKYPNTSTIIRFAKTRRLSFPGVLAQAFLALLLAITAHSQPMPPLKMQLPGNKVFDISEVPKGKPIILIYFDPDCDHCQKLMGEMFKKINQFKKAEIVFATFKPVSELDSLYKKYSVLKYPNVKMGTENATYYLRLYYDVTTLPFTALYDKKGNLNYSYRKETSVDDLIARLKKIQ
jgi:thiol-disulfide isomerase/thioredoxin